MTKSQMIDQFNDLLIIMSKIMQSKNHDYSGNAEDPFTNFNQIELLSKGSISRDQGCIVRMTDKLSRVQRLLEINPAVITETIEDTLIDLANYSLLLILMRRDRTNGQSKLDKDSEKTNNTPATTIS